MAGDAHWIMLLSKWLGNKIVVDVGSENNSNDSIYITFYIIRHISATQSQMHKGHPQ